MVLQHNLTAMFTNKQLGVTTKQQAKSAEKLSTGYRINRAADDAAGLQISENMRRQVRGLNKASKNAEDGISYCQVADGAMGEIDNIVHRVKELCIQGANDTNTDADREAIQREIDALADEIGNITDNTEFNTLDVFGRNLNVTITHPDGTTENTIQAVTGNNYGLGIVLGAGNVSSDTKGVLSPAGSWSVTGTPVDSDIAVYKNNKLAQLENLIGADPKSYTAVIGANPGLAGQNPLEIAVGSGKVTLSYNAQAVGMGNQNYTLTSATYTDAAGNVKDYGTLVPSKGEAPLLEKEYNYSTLDFQTVGAGSSPVVSDLYNQGFSIGCAGDSGYYSVMFTNDASDQPYSYNQGDSNILKIYIGDLENSAAPDAGQEIVSRIMTYADIMESGMASNGYAQFACNDSAPDNPAKLYILNNRGTEYKGGTFELIGRGTNGEQVSSDTVNRTAADGTVYTYEDRGLWIQSGDLELSGIMVEKEWLTRANIGLDRVCVDSFETASASIAACDRALEKVSSARSNMGAYMNRMEYAVAVDDNTSENVQSSESRLRDTDMADEMVQYSRSNILAQAGQSMLAQANQSTQGILSLLQ